MESRIHPTYMTHIVKNFGSIIKPCPDVRERVCSYANTNPYHFLERRSNCETHIYCIIPACRIRAANSNGRCLVHAHQDGELSRWTGSSHKGKIGSDSYIHFGFQITTSFPAIFPHILFSCFVIFDLSLH